MRKMTRFGLATGAALGLATLAAPVAAGADGNGGGWNPSGANHVVFVQTDNVSGNQVVAYDRAADGTLTWSHTYATGGLGGVLTGSVVDHLASQGSLTYDQRNNLLYAVNAGSNTVSVFSVRGDQLTLRQVVNSGGSFPVSVAVHGNLVYVLNAENGGTRPGVRGGVRPSGAPAGIRPRPRPERSGHAAVHQHARAGRLLARRIPVDRDHQGQRERHRRVRCRVPRVPVGSPGGERRSRARCPSVSPSTRPAIWWWPNRAARRRRWPRSALSPRRDGDPARPGAHRTRRPRAGSRRPAASSTPPMRGARP